MQAVSTTTPSVKAYNADELSYKRVGMSGNAYLIDAYHGSRLLMTYRGYYNHRNGEFTLYPSVSHRIDSRIPGKHVVHVTKVR